MSPSCRSYCSKIDLRQRLTFLDLNQGTSIKSDVSMADEVCWPLRSAYRPTLDRANLHWSGRLTFNSANLASDFIWIERPTRKASATTGSCLSTSHPRVFASDGALPPMRPAAFVAPKTKAAEHSVRPLGEIKTLRCSNRSSRFRFR